MAHVPTLPPDHPGMWRRLVARTHPDAGGDHELFIWTAEKAASKGRKAFEAPVIPGADTAFAQMNYRHALDSVEGLTDHRDLDARLERAVLTGDTTLARAVAHRANESANAGVVRKYLDNVPDAREAWEAWADAHEELQKLQSYGETLAFGYAAVEEPPEIRHPEARAEMAGDRSHAG